MASVPVGNFPNNKNRVQERAFGGLWFWEFGFEILEVTAMVEPGFGLFG
jgi:hypothetical protein